MQRGLCYWTGIALIAAAPLVVRATARPAMVSNVAPAQSPARIASLSPSTTEYCAALGLIDRMVARSTFCDWPPQVARVPDVGGLLDPNLERLVMLRPDLVLLPGNSRMLRDALAGTDLNALALPDSTLDDVYSSLTTLGRLTARGEQASRVVDEIRRDLAALQSAARPQKQLRVLLVVEAQPPIQQAFVAGPGSYLDTLLRMAGYQNAMSSLNRPWAEVGVNRIVEADPDVIIEFRPMPVRVGHSPTAVPATTPILQSDDAPASDEGAASAVQAWARLDGIEAVRMHRVYIIRGQHHVVPGPRVARTLRLMIKVLAA